jgi:type I restriction enzyme S subunit
MQTGRDMCLRIGLYDYDFDTLISPAYTTFEVDTTKVVPEYFFMLFKSDEMDRYCAFLTDGSIRANLDWEVFCDIDVELPSIEIQKKYVAVYKAMVANQKAYEKGLDDLKLVCDAYIENLGDCEYKVLGNYIERNMLKNQDEKFNKTQVKGFNNEGEFIKPMRLFAGDVSTFKVIKKDYFVYNSRVNSTITKLSIALNEGEELIVTPAYESFYVKNTHELDSYYLYMLLQREIFAKKVLFNSFGSATLFFSIEDLEQIKIPLPSIDIQRAIANMYRVYKERRSINEKLKAHIKALCPILIRGSLEEGKA